MVGVIENKRRLDIHYKTGYTQYLNYAFRVTGNDDRCGDLLNDTYLFILRTIMNSGCTDGVSHNYIIRSIKLNNMYLSKVKSNYDNYHKENFEMMFNEHEESDDEQGFYKNTDHQLVYDPWEEQDEILLRLFKEIKLKVIESYVKKHFNLIEQRVFEMKYVSGFSHNKIHELMNQKNVKYSKAMISMIFKRIHEELINNFKNDSYIVNNQKKKS